MSSILKPVQEKNEQLYNMVLVFEFWKQKGSCAETKVIKILGFSKAILTFSVNI